MDLAEADIAIAIAVKLVVIASVAGFLSGVSFVAIRFYFYRRYSAKLTRCLDDALDTEKRKRLRAKIIR